MYVKVQNMYEQSLTNSVCLYAFLYIFMYIYAQIYTLYKYILFIFVQKQSNSILGLFRRL